MIRAAADFSTPEAPAGSLARLIGRIAHRQRSISIARTLLLSAFWALVLLMPLTLLAGLGWARFLPLRGVPALVAWPTIGAIGWILVHRAARRRDLVRVAREIEDRFPAIEERISSALQLAGEGKSFAGSVELRTHLSEQALADAETLSPHQIVPINMLRRPIGLIAMVLAMWGVVALIPGMRRTAAIGTSRLVMPWKDQLPDALADVTALPGDVTLTEGDGLSVIAKSYVDHALLVRQPRAGPRLTQEMEPDGVGQWRGTVRDVHVGFSYQVVTDRDSTRWFKAVVISRPAIQSLSVRYEYPKYTGMPGKTQDGLDGTIDALLGTHVTLRLRVSEPLDLGRSCVEIRQPNAKPVLLRLDRVKDGDVEYEAKLTVGADSSYGFDLMNASGVGGKSEPPRRIFARPDQLPSIVVQSPEPDVSVRPDDLIPIEFLASDDFGVARIEALIQVDGADLPIRLVPFDSADPRHVEPGGFQLSATELLSDSNKPDAKQIVYQLRVVDNRDPNPQSEVSLRQRLSVDANQARSYQGKIEEKTARTLEAIISSTIRQLDEAKPRLTQAKTRDVSAALGEWQRKELAQAARDLPGASMRLARAASEAADSVLQPVASQVARIADGPLRTAAEQAARADLDADLWQQRNDAIGRSTAAIAEARDALQKLLDGHLIEQRRGEAEAARDLAAAKALQEKAAGFAQKSDAAQAFEAQKRAVARLRQAMAEAPALQNEAAKQLAQRLQEAIRAIRALREQNPIQPSELANVNRRMDSLKSDSSPDVSARAAKAVKTLAQLPAGNRKHDETVLEVAEQQLRGLDEQEKLPSDDPQSSRTRAALNAQEADQAQREISGPNLAASSQAAAALQRAASAMSLALNAAGAASAGDTTSARRRNDALASGPGATGRSGAGGPLPASIRDLGISPDQWAKFSPQAQRDVLGAAQQSGPPAYRQMIRDYYVKVSQMPRPREEGRP